MSETENFDEQRARKKKVVLQCPCHFTRTGLEVLISEPTLSASLEIVASSNSFEESEILLGCLPTVDIVLLMLDCHDYSMASFLHLISDSLPKMHSSCTVVLVGKAAHMDMLMHYFSGLKNTMLILDSSSSLMKLQKQLLDIDRACGEDAKDGSHVSALLSSRELLVLRRLLDGESSGQIADDLELHYKTVSHYKRAALAKMGIRSLCPLVMHRYSDSLIKPQTIHEKHAIALC